jgi:hypothetical protein
MPQNYAPNRHTTQFINTDKKEVPQNEEYVDENGIRTTIEYAENEEGKRVKVRRSNSRRYLG